MCHLVLVEEKTTYIKASQISYESNPTISMKNSLRTIFAIKYESI